MKLRDNFTENQINCTLDRENIAGKDGLIICFALLKSFYSFI